jgi:hydroxymethylpyrimidine pyrophosphatase-like HAD family hydrolase
LDYYLDDNNAVDRLIREWKKYGKIIIAVDFDDTIYNYHNIPDREYKDVIKLLQLCKEIGCYIIIFTACDESKYDFITNYCNDNNIEVDKINDNLDFVPYSGRKVYFNIALDDRGGLSSSYRILKESAEHMKYERTYERHCV